MRRFIILSLLAAALAGCRSTDAVTISANFDPKEAAHVKQTGATRIDGHAFLKLPSGKPIFAVGETVRLIPATAYARERFQKLYGGAKYVAAKDYPAQVPADPAYGDYMRVTKSESSGRFSFETVAPGTYFVSTAVVWKPEGEFLPRGGAVYEMVTVTGKEDKPIKLILNGT